MPSPFLTAVRESVALRAASLILGVLGAAALGYRMATGLQGEVTDEAGAPIRGADVVMFTSDGAITSAQTDAEGWYRLRFPRGSRGRSALAVCAAGRNPIVTRRVEPVVWRSDFGLSVSSPAVSRMAWPDELRGRSDLPLSCQLPRTFPQA